jgi:hypothetical protein
MISQYWVGQIPAAPLVIEVKDDEGEAVNLSSYSNFEVQLLNHEEDLISTASGSLDTSNKSTGRFIWSWPTNASLFEYEGEYLFRLKITKTGALDYTTSHTIRVSEFGGTR